MNELAEQVQQAYERGGRDEARDAFVDTITERDWTREELETVQLYRSFPTTPDAR